MEQDRDFDTEYNTFKPLSDRKILFGVTGGIACFKAAEYVRNLAKEGASVQPVITKSAEKFVTCCTFSALSGQKAALDLFDESSCHEIPHIRFAQKAEVMVVLPATANIIAKFAHGIADDLLSTIFLSFTGPVLLFPSMNPDMYSHAATQANISSLRQRGTYIIEPEEGIVVCGAKGKGRLPGWETCLFHIKKALWPKGLLGKKILVTAGPTREQIDPVRFISNRSSGKMGYKLAEAAALRGAQVHLVSGPVSLSAPSEVKLHKVETAEEMAQAVFSLADKMDVIIMAAAVSDYTPAERLAHKLKKSEEKLCLNLRKSTDILLELGKDKTDRLVLVGFCAESRDLVKNAFSKLEKKNLDLVVANDITLPGAGFDSDTNKVFIIDTEENIEELPFMDKAEVSEHILDRIQELMDAKGLL